MDPNNQVREEEASVNGGNPRGDGCGPHFVGEEARMMSAIAQLAENHNAFLQWQTNQNMERGMSTGLLERFKRLCNNVFEGGNDPLVAEEWMKEVELVLDTLGIEGNQRVVLATFLFRGEARHWWNAFKRLEEEPIVGIEPQVPRVVSCERFV